MAGPQIGILCAVMVAHLTVLSTVVARKCHRVATPVRGGLCGDAIPNALRLVCSTDGYAAHGKRSEVPSLADDSEEDVDAASLIGLVPDKLPAFKEFYLGKREASIFLEKRKTEITCECCYNKCSLRELAGYCRYPAKAYARFMKFGAAFSRLLR